MKHKTNLPRACIIGNGGWGTALALTLATNGLRVRVWGPFAQELDDIRSKKENTVYLPGVPLPSAIEWTPEISHALQDACLVVLAVPTKFFRPIMQQLQGRIPRGATLVSVAKGLDEKTLERMTQVAEQILGCGAVYALSGPSHAEEVARGCPTAVTLAGPSPARLNTLQRYFSNRNFRVYTTHDTPGVELGGALKNVIAIAAGVSDGLGLGDNTRAALITRGLKEITCMGVALGARLETFAGLSGMGDLIVTCTSRHSRNHAVGERLGKGETLAQISASMRQVAEGVWNAKTVRQLARRIGVDTPITEQVYQIVHRGKPPLKALQSLLRRDLKSER